MKIRIKADGCNLNLRLPSSLIFSKTVVRIVNTVCRKYAGDALKDIPPEALEMLFAQLRSIRDRCGTWELVNIESANGEIVKIIL